MSTDIRHTIIRRVRLRQDLKPIQCLVGSNAGEVDWLTIVQVTHSEQNARCGGRIVRLRDGWIDADEAQPLRT